MKKTFILSSFLFILYSVSFSQVSFYDSYTTGLQREAGKELKSSYLTFKPTYTLISDSLIKVNQKKIRLLDSIYLQKTMIYAVTGSLSKNISDSLYKNYADTIEIYRKTIRAIQNAEEKFSLTHGSLKKLETEYKYEMESLKYLYKEKTATILHDTVTHRRKKLEEVEQEYDSAKLNLLSVWAAKRYAIRTYQYEKRLFFPAYYSQQAIQFFEGDTVHKKLFLNNAVNYSPNTKQMSIYTEAVNDFVGPVRFGIGFTIKSDIKTDSASTADSTIKKIKQAESVSSIQNNGGDISINVKFPFFRTYYPNALIKIKSAIFLNTGFSLPVLNKATADFSMTYNGGVQTNFYAKGFNDKIAFFGTITASYISGNKQFRKTITDVKASDPTSFFLSQASVGLAFMDGYRFQVDLYGGNSFVRKNFPTTVTFILRTEKK